MLLAPTLLSEISSETPSRIAVVADTREHAALFAGAPGAQLFWLDVGAQVVSNRDLPAWLEGSALPNLPNQVHNSNWLALGAPADAPPLRAMTWSQDHPREFMELYRASPFSQAALFELASEMVARENLGQSNTLDILCIVSGAMEQLGYETGAESPLMRQMALQLDRRLETCSTFSPRRPAKAPTPSPSPAPTARLPSPSPPPARAWPFPASNWRKPSRTRFSPRAYPASPNIFIPSFT